MDPKGTQLIVEFHRCQSAHLAHASDLEQILITAIPQAGLHQVRIVSHQFSPAGVTILAVISESHVALHTYPEASHISLDIFTCSNPQRSWNLVDLLAAQLKPTDVDIMEVERGEHPQICQQTKRQTIYQQNNNLNHNE